MTIVIGMEAAGRTRQGTFASAQPCATRDSAQIKPTCVAGETHPHGIAGVRELVTVRIATLVAGERIVATIRCSKRPNSPASFQSAHASRAACDLADRAYENERAKHAPDTALVRFADAVAGKASEKEDAK